MHDVFYFTDVHGNYELYDQLITWCIGNDTEAMVIYGGDACDRGDHGYRIMQELLDNPQVVYLKGNHEDMFVKAAYAMIGFCAQSDELYEKLHSKKMLRQEVVSLILSNNNSDITLYLGNGGMPTLVDWIMDGADEDFVTCIEGLYMTFKYENIDFCHAGASPDIFKRVYEAEYDGKVENFFLHSCDVQDVLWNRTTLPLGWETGRICVFGHTPTVSLPTGIYGRDQSLAHSKPCAWRDKMGAIEKRGGWKIDMDTAGVWSDIGYVLNCLTFKVTGFCIERQNEGSITKIIDEYKII